MLDTVAKQSIMTEYQRKAGDTGSPEVQVALLSAKISDLQQHFKTHKKDVHSRLGLMKMVAKRRKLMKYIKRSDVVRYRELLKQLNLRDVVAN
jgi:small subunit ribosomal protein S15